MTSERIIHAGLNRRRFLGVTGGLVLLGGGGTLLSGCGGSSSASEEISIVNSGSVDTLAMQRILDSRGYFDQFGVKTTTTNVTDGSKATAAVTSGRTDVSMLNGFSQIFPAINQGASLRLIGGTLAASSLTLWSAQSDVSSLRDLEGRTVGTGAVGSLLYQIMIAMFDSVGVDSSKVTFVNVGASSDVLKAVSAKRVDAGLSSIAFQASADQFGIHRVVDVYKELPKYTNQGAFATTKTISSKRAGLVAVLAAYNKLFKYLQSPESKDTFLDAYTAVGGDEAGGKVLWNFYQTAKPYDTDISLSDEAINYMQQLNVNTSTQPKLLPVSKVADMSLATDALALKPTA